MQERFTFTKYLAISIAIKRQVFPCVLKAVIDIVYYNILNNVFMTKLKMKEQIFKEWIEIGCWKEIEDYENLGFI